MRLYSPGLFFAENSLIINVSYLLVMYLFRFSMSLSISFGSFYVSKNVLTSSELSTLLAYIFSVYILCLNHLRLP